MVIGQLAITCIYYGFVGLARCMEHLNNSQHIPYLQGSRVQRRCAGVPHDAKGEFHKANYSEESARVSRCHKQSAEKGKCQQITGRWKTTCETAESTLMDGLLTPNWVKEGLQMASLVFDASKLTECPLQLL